MERFWGRVNKTDSCWTWEAFTNAGGYGYVWFDGKMRLAHRIAYELAVGPVPTGLELDHLCHNPRCVRPEHLEAVTHVENIRRAADLVTHCPQGHLYDRANTYYMRRRPGRQCRACHRDNEKQRRRVSA